MMFGIKKDEIFDVFQNSQNSSLSKMPNSHVLTHYLQFKSFKSFQLNLKKLLGKPAVWKS